MSKCKYVFAAIVSVLLSACGGGGGGDGGSDNGGDVTSNSAPSVTFSSPSDLSPGAPFSIQFSATDADGDALTYKAQWVTPVSSPLSVSDNVITGAIPNDITSNITLGILLSVSDGKITTNKTINIPVVVSNSSPIVQIGSGLKSKVFGGYSFSVSYSVSDADTPQGAIRVNGLSDSDKLTLSVDEQSKKINMVTSPVDSVTLVNVKIIAFDGKSNGETSFTVSLSPTTSELSTLQSELNGVKAFVSSGSIKNEDLSFAETLGVIALSKGTITPDDIEREKATISLEHDNMAAITLQTIKGFEGNMIDPDNISAISDDFHHWKTTLLSNYAPNSVARINGMAQAASVSGLVDASVSITFPYAESRFLGSSSYNNFAEGKEPWFKDEFIWMYATEGGFGKACVWG